MSDYKIRDGGMDTNSYGNAPNSYESQLSNPYYDNIGVDSSNPGSSAFAGSYNGNQAQPVNPYAADLQADLPPEDRVTAGDIYGDEETENPIWGKLLLILILSGFIIFIFGGIKNQPWLSIEAMGCMFVAVTATSIKQNRKKLKGSVGTYMLFSCVGLAMMIGALVFRFSDGLRQTMSDNPSMIIGPLCIAIGAIIIFSNVLTAIMNRKNCTVKVMAKCISLDASHSNKSTTYAPVYEYEYGGQMRTVRGNEYSNFGNPKLGEVREIYIEPETHSCYYEPKRELKGMIFKGLFSLFFVVIGFVILFVAK